MREPFECGDDRFDVLIDDLPYVPQQIPAPPPHAIDPKYDITEAGNWYKVPEWTIRELGEPGLTLSIFAKEKYVSKTSETYRGQKHSPSGESLAELCGVSPSTWFRHRRQLENAGYTTTKGRERAGNGRTRRTPTLKLNRKKWRSKGTQPYLVLPRYALALPGFTLRVAYAKCIAVATMTTKALRIKGYLSDDVIAPFPITSSTVAASLGLDRGQFSRALKQLAELEWLFIEDRKSTEPTLCWLLGCSEK